MKVPRLEVLERLARTLLYCSLLVLVIAATVFVIRHNGIARVRVTYTESNPV